MPVPQSTPGLSERPWRHRQRFSGFSLVEALVAIAILGLAASAIMLSSQASMQATRESLDRTIAAGIARQLIDEVLGMPYHESGETAEGWPLGPETGEQTTPPQRIAYDDTDDFSEYQATPPEDEWAILLGQGSGTGVTRWEGMRIPADYFDGWTTKIEVDYVDPSDLSQKLPPGSTSEFRAVTVTVREGTGNGTRILARMRRVYSYVQPPT